MNQPGEQQAIASFVHSIDVQPIGPDRFEAKPDLEDDDDRIFGGQTLAQAVVAAGRTSGEFTIQSLHAYFLRAGKPGQPILYIVDRLRDGRTFAGRRVTARQGDSLILETLVSFVRPEEGISHQLPMPATPTPHDDEVLAKREEIRRRWGRTPAFDSVADASAPGSYREAVPHLNMWWRPVAPFPEDPTIHAAPMAWVSDNDLYRTVFEHHGVPPGVTLDHAIWWHEPPRFDDWLLRVSDSPVAKSARALMLASIFSRDGRLVASIAQEGLFRGTW